MKRWLTLLLLTLGGLGGLLIVDQSYRARIHQDNGRVLEQAATDTRDRLQLAMLIRLRAVADLQTLMLASPDLPDYETFDRFAAGIMANYPTSRGLGYIDSGRVIRHFYPPAGNERAIGLDLLTRPAAPLVEKAIRERRMTVNDPTLTVQGSLSAVARAPLFKGDEFVGMVAGVFDIDAILTAALAEMDRRFAIRLVDAHGHRFWGVDAFSGDSRASSVQVGDNAWRLTVGWQSREPGPASFVLALIWGGGGALLLSVLLIANRSWTRAEWLRTTVADRTAALAESEARYRQLFDHGPDAVFVLDSSGRILDTNQVAERRYGYSRQELLHMTARDLTAPDLKEQTAGRIKQGLETGAQFEWRQRRQDGTELPVEVSVTPVSLAGQTCLLSSVRDVSEWVQARAALRGEELKLSSIYDTVADVLFLLAVEPDDQYRFVSVNRSFCRVTGLSEEQIVGKAVTDVIPQPSLALVLGNYRQAIATKTIVRWEETSEYPSGRLIGEVSIAPVFDDRGRCTHLVGSVHDITARKRAQDALRDELARFTKVVDTAPGAICSLRQHPDGSANFPYASSAVRDVFGLAPESLVQVGGRNPAIADRWSAAAIVEAGRDAAPK